MNGAVRVHIPEELLSFDIDQGNRSCEKKRDKFLFASCCPRPFEQLQFIRGTANLYMDLMDPAPKMLEFMKRMHDFYSRLMEKWAKTDVDSLNMMDDWGWMRSIASCFAWDLKTLRPIKGRLPSGGKSTDSIFCRKGRFPISIGR